MRQAIIEMLRSSGSDFLSGEEIADLLGISRAAVWKHIQKLRRTGYEIDSRERCGYKFKNAPDILLASSVKEGLDTQIIGKETRQTARRKFWRIKKCRTEPWRLPKNKPAARGGSIEVFILRAAKASGFRLCCVRISCRRTRRSAL